MNPKALNLEAARQSQTKVTTGFKCDPQVKIELAEKAQKLGLTLSQYLESLISSQEEIVNRYRDDAFNQNVRLLKHNSELKTRLMLYETDILKMQFKHTMGKSVSYIDASGQKAEIAINDLPDVNKFIQYSFKISPDA